MTKKILVTKEWHERAMHALETANEHAAFIDGLTAFMGKKLSDEEREALTKEINLFIDDWKFKDE